MKKKYSTIQIESSFDEDTGILTVSPFEQVPNGLYNLNIDSNGGSLKEIIGMPNEINGSLYFDYISEFLFGTIAESFYGFPGLITGDLYIGCRSKSLKGLEKTEVMGGSIVIRASHLKEFKYFPKISENSGFHLFGNICAAKLKQDIFNEFKEDSEYFINEICKNDLVLSKLKKSLDEIKYTSIIDREEVMLDLFLTHKFTVKPSLDNLINSL